ncbi:MAG: dienelactone hydrolase family protein [Paracoccaceae bacterium]
MMKSIVHRYSDGESTFIGRLAWDDDDEEPRPGVLIAPAFGGLGPFEIDRAEDLASQGYTVLVIDYYGDGKRATSEAEALTLMQALNADRAKLTRRMICALNEIKSLKTVDAQKIGAIGYCFGGKSVLDLARSGESFQAVASFHGVYDAPKESVGNMIPAALILHGWDDPLATPEDVLKLTAELSSKCRNWQLLAFGHTGHAFTNPKANAPDVGMLYSRRASDQSWRALLNFLEEQFKS